MLPFQKKAERMSNVAYLSKVNLPPSITLTSTVMFFHLKPVHKRTISVEKKKYNLSVTATKTFSMLEGQRCTRHLACLEC